MPSIVENYTSAATGVTVSTGKIVKLVTDVGGGHAGEYYVYTGAPTLFNQETASWPMTMCSPVTVPASGTGRSRKI